MKHLAPLALLVLLSACGSTQPAFQSFRYDLVSVIHNVDNDYTLLIYQDAEGEARHELRHAGICEIILTYTVDGSVRVKKRGADERIVSAMEAAELSERINKLLEDGRPRVIPSRSI